MRSSQGMKSAVGMAVVVAVAAAFSRGEGEVRRPVQPLPGTVATLRPADGLGAVVGARHDAWTDDRWGERLLRLDHRTGRVIARIPVDGRLALAASADALWALQSGGGYGRGLRGPLLRIDTATNRVVAAVGIRGLGFGVRAAGDSVWIWGPDRLTRVDARTNRVVQTIRVADDRGEISGFALLGQRLVITTADGHLVRFDGLGSELASVELPLRSPDLQRAIGRRLVVTSRGSVAAVEPRTGAVVWRTRLGFRVGSVQEAGGALWVYGANVDDAGDRVWKLDPASGTVRGSVLLPAFGTVGMAIIDDRLWVTTANGRVLVLRR